MLSTQDKQLIRDEEYFRDEIRREIDERKQHKKFDKLLEKLSNGFVLWFLSTVVIGLFTFVYTKSAQEFELRKTTNERLRRLDAEIAHRLAYIPWPRASFAQPAKTPDPLEQGITNMLEFIEVVLRGREKNATLIEFVEFENRTLDSLIWELREAVPKSEKPPLDTALTYLRLVFPAFLTKVQSAINLARIQSSTEAGRKQAESEGAVLPLIYALAVLNQSNLNLSRWGKPLSVEAHEIAFAGRIVQKSLTVQEAISLGFPTNGCRINDDTNGASLDFISTDGKSHLIYRLGNSRDGYDFSVTGPSNGVRMIDLKSSVVAKGWFKSLANDR